jgi:hypothetical protein
MASLRVLRTVEPRLRRITDAGADRLHDRRRIGRERRQPREPGAEIVAGK